MTCQTRSQAQRHGYFLRSSATRITKKRPSPKPPTARTKKRPSPAESSQGSNRLSGEFDEMRAPAKQQGESSHHTFSDGPNGECMRILNDLSRELGIPIEAYVKACEILACPNFAKVFVLMVECGRRYWLSSLTKDSVNFTI